MKTYEMLYYYNSNETAENITIIVGEVAEIKSVFRSMCKAWERGRIKISPMLSAPRELEQFPKFRVGKLYGILVDTDGFSVINSDTVLRIMVDTKNFEMCYRFEN